MNNLYQVAKSATAYAIVKQYSNLVIDKQKVSSKILVVASNIHEAQVTFDELTYLQKHWQVDNNFKQVKIVFFGDRETLAYDQVSPLIELISQRLKTLETWYQSNKVIMVVAASTAMQRLPPNEFFEARQFSLQEGEQLQVGEFCTKLANAGYQRVEQVLETGQFALRGGIIDVFPIISEVPFRLDLFDNQIEAIKEFNTNTQISIRSIHSLNLLPTNEFCLDEQSIALFQDRFAERFDFVDLDPVYQAVSSNQIIQGIEYYLPLLHQTKLCNLAEYCGDEAVCVLAEGVAKSMRVNFKEYQQLYEQAKQSRNVLEPRELFCDEKELCNSFTKVMKIFSSASHDSISENCHLTKLVQAPTAMNKAIDFHHRFSYFVRFASKKKLLLLIFYQSPRRKEQLMAECRYLKLNFIHINGDLSEVDLTPESSNEVVLIQGQLRTGFIDTKQALIFCSELDLFGRILAVNKPKWSSKAKHISKLDEHLALSSIQVGEPVVHLEHGIGLYKGLQTVEVDGYRNDVIAIEYQKGSTLYVPVEKMHFVERYIGNSETVTISDLSTKVWNKRKYKAKQKLEDFAAELLEIYALRNNKKRIAVLVVDDYANFVDFFPYDETEGQLKAEKDILADFSKDKPMDRLICGDVGFGKTEIAMRAAYISVTAGKQVAILVPTTLLAQQHYQNFLDRFVGWAVKIEMVSRLRSDKEVRVILKQCEEGKVDILIGTHRLLQKDVRLPNLGLAIIDEEHRFGVKQKEVFKQLRAEIDILSMTATPIPRSLNMAFTKLRDISIISSPPLGRMSVKTFVNEWTDELGKEAILREIRRGGQVYMVHNNIATILNRQQEIQDLIPDADVQVVHGQMPQKSMEAVVSSFYNGEFNVLVCTTIIETGIDIPNANTLLVDRADKFGLAQLHQLRGRVGRSHHQAYAYLFTPSKDLLKSDAKKRLFAIKEAQDLGSGFRLALEDLEIRGAGEILGDDQKGHIQNIGLNLYLDMLNRTLNELSESTEAKESSSGVEIDLMLAAFIPPEYIEDVPSRLRLYNRLQKMSTEQSEDFAIELHDRFGKLPNEVKNLIEIHQLNLRCQDLGIASLNIDKVRLNIELLENNRIDINQLLHLLGEHSDTWKLKDSNTLTIRESFFEQFKPQSLVQTIHRLLNDLQTSQEVTE